MRNIALPYGEKTLLINTAEKDLLEAPRIEATSDMQEMFLTALQKPFSGSPLREVVKNKAKIVIIINDITRQIYSAEFLPHFFEEIKEQGIGLDKVTILIATGAHRPATPAEIKTLVGRYADQVNVISHMAFEDKQLVKIGVTSYGTEVYLNKLAVEADCLIITGGITFHYLAGFSGGRKSILPGVAGFKSISANHSLILENERDLCAVIQSNPVAQDMEEAAAMINPAFSFNVVLNAEGELVKVFSGNWKEAHLAGCEFVRKEFGVAAPKKGFVVASAGGFPKDINFYQAFKGLYTAVQLVEEGGEVIFYAACCENVGEDEFLRFADSQFDTKEKEKILAKEFSIARYAGYLTAQWAKKARIYLVSDMSHEIVQSMGLIPISSEEAFERIKQIDEKWVIPHAGSLAVV